MITSNWWKKHNTHIDARLIEATPTNEALEVLTYLSTGLFYFKRDQYIETTSNPFYSTYVSVL